MREKKRVITIVITIVVLLASGIGGYVSYGIFVNQSDKKSESTKNVREKDKESAKPEKEEIKKEEESVEPLMLTDDQKGRIESAAYLYDLAKAEGEDRNNRQEYTYDCSDNQIPKDVLKMAAGSIACDNADDFGVEVREEPGYGETTLSTDQCIDFLKNTFGYEASDYEAVAEVLDPEGDDAFLLGDNSFRGLAETQYKASYFAQTGKDKYHFYVEVQPYDEVRNQYSTAAIMDITAHKNDKSEIVGFVFDKVELTKDTQIYKVREAVDTLASDMVREKCESSGQGIDGYKPIGTYDANQFTNEEFYNLTNQFLNTKLMSGKLSQDPNYPDHYDEYIILIDEYVSVCQDTLGRTEDFDYSQWIRDNNVIIGTGWLDAMYDAEDASIVQSYDGSVDVTGVIKDCIGNRAYSYTAKGHVDAASEMGFVIDQLNVTVEVAVPEY